jgi:hypothetical protein
MFLFCAAVFGLIDNPSYALSAAELNVGAITAKNWSMAGVRLAVIGLNQTQQQFKLSATQLNLPKPFDDIKLIDIQCDGFTWRVDDISCTGGRAQLKSAYWQSPKTKFTFKLGKQKSSFTFEDSHFISSHLGVTAISNGQSWQAEFSAKHINQDFLNKLLNKPIIRVKPSQGYLNVKGKVNGWRTTLLGLSVNAELENVNYQQTDGKVATEKLRLQSQLTAKKSGDYWQWQQSMSVLGGAVYIDPIYIEAGYQPITLNAHGVWYPHTHKITIANFEFSQPDAMRLSGSATGYFSDKFQLEQADVYLVSNSLNGLITNYIKPFITESPLAGLLASGELAARFSIARQKLTETAITLSQINVHDGAGQFAASNVSGELNWSNDSLIIKQSRLAWQQITVKGVPVEASRITLSSRGRHFKLADKLELPLLDGWINVDQFSWTAKVDDEPDIVFAGAIERVSLEKLSKSLGWVPLSGNISGQIPSINYHNKVLNLDGELLVNVFDGLIKINNLTASGLLSGLPKISSDIAVEQLDLAQLTGKFEFGSITGKLSGYINKLVLENWRPVTFYAWFGTPDSDNSSHSISQKAVNNIASIGGGGATDVLSRSFLGFFDTFRYDKIGVGCYLHDGVCQMMGLVAEQEGYYLVKGGCLPRIDVLGYNTRVNWDVLVERLARVASPDKAIIQ